jgi:methyl-accepting chemotaxis protein
MEDIAVDPLMTAALGTSVRTIGFTGVVREGDKVIGYWTNRADVRCVEEIITQLQLDSGQAVRVDMYSSSGVLLASASPPGVEPRPVGVNAAQSGYAPAQKLVAGESGSLFLREGDAPERVHGYAASNGALGFAGLGWGVDVSIETSVAGATMLDGQRRAWIAGGVLLVLIGGIALFVGRRISAPITEMATVASKLAEGDVEQTVSHSGADEIGQLADSFRSLMQYVKDASDKIALVGAGQARIDVTPRSDKDMLSKGLAQASSQVSYLVEGVMGAALAAERGELSARVEVGTLQGDFAELAHTTNHMIQTILAPSAAATAALERVAACDLTATVEGDFSGDHARLKNALNTAVASIRGALLQVSRGSEQVKAASSQIAAGSQTLASGASEQAASLTETRAVLESVAQMTSRNAENAQHANALSLAARESSSRGAGAMEHMTQAVGKIRAAVENTAQIIRDINQIAF